MSQGRKRSRKSKLEVRDDDSEYELVVSEKNDETPHLQKQPKVIYKLQYPSVFDHDYCKPGFQTFYPSINCSRSYQHNTNGVPEVQDFIELSVKVEVQKYDDDGMKKPEKKSISILRKMESNDDGKEKPIPSKKVIAIMMKLEPDDNGKEKPILKKKSISKLRKMEADNDRKEKSIPERKSFPKLRKIEPDDDGTVKLIPERKSISKSRRIEHDNDGKENPIPENKSISILRKMEPTKKIKQMSAIAKCKYDPQELFRASEEIALTSGNPADKILDIEMRNLWGNVLNTPDVVSPHETILQMAIETWQAWCHGSRQVRDSPLFYQCHICHLAWWRLQPFREHLREHDLRTLKVTLKENIHECMIIASNQTVFNLLFIDIHEDCWKCGNNLEFHKNYEHGYQCIRCKRSMYTCSLLSDHESTCLYSNIDNFNIAKERQCTICKRFIDNIADVDKHMVLAHTVRSDVPVPVNFKQCSHCSFKYFKYSLHNCCMSPKNNSCEHCCRKFAMKPLAVAHRLSQYNRPTLCRICAELIPAKCQEMEHVLAEHSNNYQLVYKCTICLDQSSLFVDEVSIKMHKQHWHQKKIDKRRSFYVMMLVPKHCLNRDEEVVMETIEHDDVNQDASEESQLRVLAADVDVTVDKIDIKKERIEYSENGEIDYEEMLNNMFNKTGEPMKTTDYVESSESCIKSETTEVTTDVVTTDVTTTNVVTTEVVTTDVVTTDVVTTDVVTTDVVTTEVETASMEVFKNIQIKTEITDDIYIIENPVDTVEIKSEPNDEYETENGYENQDQVETLTVKVETDVTMEDIKTEDIIIKNEIPDDESNNISTESIPYEQLITDLKSNDMDWVSGEMLNPDEMSFDVMNPSGLYKKKKLYACHKCGYTAQHKQYKVHISSHCSVSPGISSSHPCTKCGLNFVMFRNYVLHFDTHGYEVMSCPKCCMQFDTLHKLLSHVQKHIRTNYVGIHVLNSGGEETTRSQKQSKCQECRDVVHHADMFSHWEAHLTLKDTSMPAPVQEEPPELTVDCERVTMNNKTLDPAALRLAIEHLQATSTEKECIICYRVFARRYDVKRHIVEHLLMDAHMNKSRNKCFQCQICSTGFQGQEQYKFHMREHGSMPIFKCELCDKTFSDSSNFAKHKKTHNVRVLVCDLCSKKFHSRSALLKHITEHSRVGRTQCPMCDANFVSKQAYKRHKFKVHVKNKYKCVLCDVSFPSLQKKWDHNWEVHEERKQNADCPICFKSFRKFQDVRIHARSEHRADMNQLKQARAYEMYRNGELEQESEQ